MASPRSTSSGPRSVACDARDAALGEVAAAPRRAARSTAAGCGRPAAASCSARRSPTRRPGRSPGRWPATCAATWISDSAMTGLTLPGMIELPGWTSGSVSSPRPVRGPEASRRMSLAIFSRLTATVRSAPGGGDDAVQRRLGLEVVLGLADRRRRSAREISAQTRAANSGWVLSPVPTAVPPSATSASSSPGPRDAPLAALDLARRSRGRPGPGGSASRPAGGSGRS